MKEKRRKSLNILGMMMILLLAFTSCSKDDDEQSPTQVENQQEIAIHNAIDNSTWKADVESYSHVESNTFYWDVDLPLIMEYKFYSTDSVELMIAMYDGTIEHTYTMYSVSNDVIHIKFRDELDGNVTNILNNRVLIIDFYSQGETIRYEKFEY